MENNYAILINQRLGVELFNPNNVKRLELNKFTKKQIQKLYIDDLVDPETKKGTARLASLVKEIISDGWKE